MTTNAHIRWMIKRDLPEVLVIEEATFDDPWTELDLLIHLKAKNTLGKVAEIEGKVVAYVVYEIHKGALEVLNLVVHHDYRRIGIGSQLMRRLLGQRDHIGLGVRERLLDCQLFLRSMGFKCEGVMRDWYEDSDDLLLMFGWTNQVKEVAK